uniref:Pyridoxal-phosphate dependent enzyme n=1 Tax=Ignisphaera aggregans TaxID=334771 RepID=A0A7C5TI71_9CREN
MAFQCNVCSNIYKFDGVVHGFRCSKCGSPLEVYGFERIWNPNGFGLYRYSSMIFLKPVKTLGEGFTPVVSMDLYGFRVYFKLEYFNPSGSFKDRGSSISLSHAYLINASCVVEDSSGNAGFSTALYSRALNIKSYIVVPSNVSYSKRLAIEVAGGEVIEASSREDASRLAQNISLDKKCYYVDHLSNPLYIEGYRTIAYEAFEQIGDIDAVVVPVGSGGLFIGIYRGFEDLYRIGLIKKMPRMIAVQGVDIAPIYEKLYLHKPSNGVALLADGIRIKSPPRIDEVVSIIIKSKGLASLVNDDEIVNSIKELRDMGFIVEPTSATVYAALKKNIEGFRKMGIESILMPLTGTGIKMLQQLKQIIQ